jgi:hypothetical protein
MPLSCRPVLPCRTAQCPPFFWPGARPRESCQLHQYTHGRSLRSRGQFPGPSAGRHSLRSLRRGARPGNGQREGHSHPLTPERSRRRLSHPCHRTFSPGGRDKSRQESPLSACPGVESILVEFACLRGRPALALCWEHSAEDPIQTVSGPAGGLFADESSAPRLRLPNGDPREDSTGGRRTG